jgi:4-carboxymuconolactone decarboxylase
MSRIPDITERDQVPEADRPIFDSIVASRGSVRGPFKVMMHSAELAGRVAHVGAYVRFESKLPSRVRELAALATATLLDCEYERVAHENAARGLGFSEDVLKAVHERRADGIPNDERWIYDLVDQLVNKHRIVDATFKVAQEKLGVPGLVELVSTSGYYAMIAAPLNAFEVQPG